jgi:hypothetical protein
MVYQWFEMMVVVRISVADFHGRYDVRFGSLEQTPQELEKESQ